MADPKEYFSKLAKQASEELVKNHSTINFSTLIVRDTEQQSRAIAWEAVSIHPLQVLETEYLSIVRNAGKGKPEADRKELQFQALSRFFTLGTTPLTLLELDRDDNAKGPQRTLIDDQLGVLRAQLALARTLIVAPQADLSALGVLGDLVEHAGMIIEAMVPPAGPGGTREWLAPSAQSAANYLGLFDHYETAASARETWCYSHQNVTRAQDLEQLANELSDQVVKPLCDSANALASVRALYNIQAFYLFRLLHRFEGGSALAPKSDQQGSDDIKGEASGLVTGKMHDSTWVSDWHESQIAALYQEISNRSRALSANFGRGTRQTLKFFLKGGRALCTALGVPQQGSNDWDTGILIDPSLEPDQWYRAFAAVNDLILRTLDQMRFGYTGLLYRKLPNHDTLATSSLAAWKDDEAEYTRLGNAAEDELRRSRASARLPLHTNASSALSVEGLRTVINGDPHPVGVNGELLDIGIPTRSSVELRELWNIQLMTKKGASGVDLPVPDLGFFVDDFSTILREAVASPGAVDRKLAKRISRLKEVLEKSPDLATAVEDRHNFVQKWLPETLGALKPAPSNPTGRLQVWTLHSLLTSLRAAPERAGWLQALDRYMVNLARRGLLYQNADQVWNQIEKSFEHLSDKGASARALLEIQNGTHLLVDNIVKDFRLRETDLGVSQLGKINPSEPWKHIKAALDSLSQVASRSPNTALVVTGELAHRLQVRHADLTDTRPAWPVHTIELELWLTELRHVKEPLAQMDGVLKHLGFGSYKVGEGQDSILYATLNLQSRTTIIDESPDPVVLVIRPTTFGALDTFDQIKGWLVTPTRQLVHRYLDRAASSTDYDLRKLAHDSADVLLQELLGRQI